MEKEEAIKWLSEMGRYTISPEYAKELCDSIGVKYNENLEYTEKHYRENVSHPELARVSVNRLAEYIAKELGIEPDSKTLSHANSMFGEGSFRDLHALAYMKPLMNK